MKVKRKSLEAKKKQRRDNSETAKDMRQSFDACGGTNTNWQRHANKFRRVEKEAEKKEEIPSTSGSKINMKYAEDSSLPATSSQALPIKDATTHPA